MRALVLLLVTATPLLPGDEDPQQAIRAKMEASIARQRESVQKQVNAAAESNSSWYTTPWPKPENWIQPIAAPALVEPPANSESPSPPQVSRSLFAMPCDPLPAGDLNPAIERAADREGYSPNLLRAVIRKESAFYPCAVSSKGAMGLMQLMPATAATLGVADPLDPMQNLDGGARFLGQLLGRYQGDLARALAAYNAGPDSVDTHGGIPPYAETRNYVRDVMGALGLAP
jgi:soluble lytic murein transglycosylase-like protein